MYLISEVFPVSAPYSSGSDWQKVVTKAAGASEDDLVSKILSLRNRNWIKEQIQLHNEKAHA